MEQNEEKIAGTNLTTVPEYSQTAIGLAELSRRLKGLVFDVTTKGGMKAAKEARAEARKLRTTLEAKRKEIKAPALERCRQIDEEAKRITGEIVALEEPIALQIENEEARAEAERLAEMKREQDRIDVHKAAIQAWRDLPGTMIGWPSSRIERHLSQMEAPDFTAFEEFAQEASDAYAACHARIQLMYQDVMRQEADALRLKAQEAELAAARERIERMEREAQERRQADEKREREEEEARQRKANHERQMILSEIEGIRQQAIIAVSGRLGVRKGGTLECFEQTLAETEAWVIDDRFGMFIDAAQEAKEHAIASIKHDMNAFIVAEREKAERAEADRIERQRLADEAAESARKAAEAEQARQDAIRQAEAQRRASLTVEKAATALLERAIREGHGTWPEAIDMGEVLAKDGKRQAAKPAKVAR